MKRKIVQTVARQQRNQLLERHLDRYRDDKVTLVRSRTAAASRDGAQQYIVTNPQFTSYRVDVNSRIATKDVACYNAVT